MWVASFRRWRSPPESVVSGWPRATYPRPTSASRLRIACAAGVRASPVPEELERLRYRHLQDLADVLAGEPVLEHLGLEAPALAHLAGGGDPGHQREVGVDDPGAAAVGAGALRVRAEEGGLDAVRPSERLADGV